MKEEAEIMDELHGLDGELKSFPSEAHWFCPRRHNDDQIDYNNPDDAEEDMSPETKHELIQDAKRRHDVAYKYSLILGLASDISGSLLGDYTQRLNELLTTCDKCVINWHMGRKAFLKDLTEYFDDDTVSELSNRLDAIDFLRIDTGLKSAQKILAEVDPPQRTQAILMQTDETALLALYEALCCVNYHKSEEKLSKYFNYVFEQIQTRKVLRIADILPAMAHFLFSKGPIRLRFATFAWQKMKLELSPAFFEWVVHDNLSEAMAIVSPPSADQGDILQFWSGFLSILVKMDQGIIAHSLRAMDVQPDIYFLALQHLTSDSEATVELVIEALRCLLKKASKDFWSALGTVSPPTVAEQIFQSAGYMNMLMNDDNFLSYSASPTTVWIPDFIESLSAAHQHDACRSLLYNLFERLQDNRVPEKARLACCRAGLNAIHVTLQTFICTDYIINPSTSLIIINDILGLVDNYKGMITGCADLQDGSESDADLKKLGMLVLQDALALDCKAISAEYHYMVNGTAVQLTPRKHSQSIWQAVLDIFRPGNIELAKSIVSATSALTGMDELRPANKKNIPALPDDHVQFNKDFQELMDNICRIFERLSDFSSFDLQQLYQNAQTARPLFAALISAHRGTCEATVELIKAMTDQSGKQDAISSLLEQALIPVLNSLTHATETIRRSRNFGPIPPLIKIGREILTALCGNTGILRARSTSSTSEKNAIMGWWNGQWRILDMVFSTLEAWSPRVNQSTAYMQDFCRDGMEYAEALFDEYTIVASALGGSNPSSSDDEDAFETSYSSKASLRRVLDVVCRNAHGLTMLLRLRDTYLISVITSLLGKLLRSLGECQLEVEAKISTYIMDACKQEHERDFKRTNLTNQQKAELLRAVSEHQGLEIIEISSSTMFKKQGTIDAWSKSADGRKQELNLTTKNSELGSTTDKQQATLDKMKAQVQARSMKFEQTKTDFKESRRKTEEERKRQNLEAVAKAKALRGPAGVRGEGSGLKDIGGVAGKDHAPIRSEIMVGSSDEDDDDDDEDETNALVKIQKGNSKKVTEYEESKRRALKQMQQGPVKKTRVQRSAKDLRARVEPNMDQLYLQILNWDLFHTGNNPPSNIECRKIADSFLDLDLYKRTFWPLLVSEVWQSLVTAREENSLKPIEITVLNRLSVDKFMEVSTNMPMTMNRDLKVNERDIVLLSRGPDPMGNSQEAHCLARVDRTNRKKDLIEVTFRVSRDVNQAFLSCLAPKAKIYAVKITDMTTTQREYASLSSLEYYDLCNEVLEAKPSPIHKYPDDKISLMSSKYALNRGQSQAILSAHDNDGFTLIQGPPGSGKTKTIVAMVGALLTQSLHQQAAEHTKARPQVQGQFTALPPPKKKLLICAPSNAAVDELVVRLMEGIQPLSGPRQKIKVIRIGRTDAISAGAKDVVLEELVRKMMEGGNSEKNKLQMDRDKLHQDAAQIKEHLNALRPQMDEALTKGDKSLELELRREFDKLKRSQAHIGAKIDQDKEAGSTVTRQNDINRRKYQQEILNGAHVICSTLSGSGHDMFRHLNVEFETVIIDEAAQCIELSALIPLKYGCSKCILVGDPEQLPPTVLSRSAQSFGYEQSLFVRMQRNHPKDVHLLDTQYRMHPEISLFPSQEFYGSRLIDGNGMARLRDKPWHASSILGPYRFFDIKGVQTKENRGHSFINIPELNAAMKLYERLKTDYKSVDFKGMIGIIATYKAQLNELKARFVAKYGEAIFDEIEFNTTDAFQGREREIIIFSCVRATQTGGIGFLKDIRRMNVGLTRAKSSLWVLGDLRSLQQGEFWNKLIENAKARDRYTGGDVLTLLSNPTSRDRKLANQAISTLVPQASSHPAGSPTSVDLLNSTHYASRPRLEDNDIEMPDVPGLSSPRKPSLGSSSSIAVKNRPSMNRPGGLGIKQGHKTQNPTIKQGNLQTSPISSSTAPIEGNSHGKRRREPSVEEEDDAVQVKNAPSSSDLETALAAHKAAKPSPAVRPAGPPGVAPPRKKAPPDPFIRKKPVRRNA